MKGAMTRELKVGDYAVKKDGTGPVVRVTKINHKTNRMGIDNGKATQHVGSYLHWEKEQGFDPYQPPLKQHGIPAYKSHLRSHAVTNRPSDSGEVPTVIQGDSYDVLTLIRDLYARLGEIAPASSDAKNFLSFRATATAEGKIKIVITADTFPGYAQTTPWTKVRCNEYKNADGIKSMCSPDDRQTHDDRVHPRTNRTLKVFLKSAINMSDLCRKIKTKKITLHEFTLAWLYMMWNWRLLGWTRYAMINHNRDVDFFHVKFEAVRERR